MVAVLLRARAIRPGQRNRRACRGIDRRMATAVTVDSSSDKPIASYDELLALFHDAIKPASQFRVGAEMEKFGVYDDGTPLPYEGDVGVRAVLEELAKQGCTPDAETEGGPLIALLRDGASVTLEPGPMTMAACEPDSQDADFVRLLGDVATYVIADGELYLNLAMDAGDMVFVPAAS